MTNEQQKNPSSAQARGKRLRYIRKDLLRLSRGAFEFRHKDLKITEASLQNWEEARYKGLKEEHIDRLLEAFKREGLICEKYWLLDEIGNPPSYEKLLHHPILLEKKEVPSEVEMIARELRLFRESHIDAVDAIVSDEGLSPWCKPGDYVAGVRYIGKDIKKVIGLPSIIQTQSGQIFIRKIEKGTGDTFKLISTNPKFNENHEEHLFSVAPIIWWRRPLSSIED